MDVIFDKLLGKPVLVVAAGYVVEGRLLHVETSTHNGFGNIILQTSNGLVLVRGSSVQSVSALRMGHSPNGPMGPQPKIKTLEVTAKNEFFKKGEIPNFQTWQRPV